MVARSDENKNTQAMPVFADIINDFLVLHRKSPSALSRKLNMSVNGLQAIRKKKTIQIELLWKFSNIYRHNFIADIAAMLPSDYTGALQDALAEKDEAIAALKDELAAIAKERDIYKELLQR